MSATSPRLHYAVLGSGPTCLVCHGGPGLNHAMYRTLDPLANGRRLVYWDHRGHGDSESLPDQPVSMALFADDAVALADRLGLDTFAVFGHSFGGWVAQELALRHPERVSALILAATTPGQLGDTEARDDDQGPPPSDAVRALMATTPTTDAALVDLYRNLAPFFLRGADQTNFVSALDPARVSATSMARVFEALEAWSAVDRLGSLGMPTLVLSGRQDEFCSPQQSVRIARRIPRAELVVFEDSGHFMWLEEPKRFFPLVEKWLRANE